MRIICLFLLIAAIACQDTFLSVPSEKVIPQNFSSCQSNSIISISKAFAMSVPTKGQNITFILLGSVSGLVQLKTVNLVVLLQGVQITTLSYASSQVFSPGQTFEYKFVQFIPTFAPSGSYTCQFEYIDINGKQDGCTQVSYILD